MSTSKKLLRDLIALPSVNPFFLPEGHPNAGEHRIADFLAASAAVAGMDVDFQPVFGRPRSNLLARLTPSGKVRQRIVLAPHMDTVDAANDGQFMPVEKNGRMYGRGACDTKGSIAAMFSAVRELAVSGWRSNGTEIVFAALVDEEKSQAGSRALANSGFQADLAIVGEPTQLKVVTAHKGSIYLRLETKGKAAHGSCPHLGRNAVLEMARVVELLEGEYVQLLNNRTHSLLGHPTVNVGGVQANIVPAACSILADRRTIPGEKESEVLAEVRNLLKSHGLKATVISAKESACLPLETSPSVPLVKQFMGAAGQSQPIGAQYFCDAAILSSKGIPSVVFGPGGIAQAHTDDEWISLESLERGTRVLGRFLKSLEPKTS